MPPLRDALPFGPKEITICPAENGYIVSWYEPPPDRLAKGLAAVETRLREAAEDDPGFDTGDPAQKGVEFLTGTLGALSRTLSEGGPRGGPRLILARDFEELVSVLRRVLLSEKENA